MGEKSERVDAYIEKAADFARPILKRVRTLYHKAWPDIEETVKWGVPYFEYKGMVGGMAAFKHHVSIGFWKTALLSDPKGLFSNGGSSMSAYKMNSEDDLPAEDVLIAYIREAVDLNERGVKLPRSKKTEPSGRVVECPADLAAALADRSEASATWDGFSYSNKKEYAGWISGAKQQATREKRIAQAVEWMAEGKPRNWKYMPKYRE